MVFLKSSYPIFLSVFTGYPMPSHGLMKGAVSGWRWYLNWSNYRAALLQLTVCSTFTVTIPTGKAHLPAEHIADGTDSVSSTLTTQPFVEEALRWLPQEQRPATRYKAQVWHKPDG